MLNTLARDPASDYQYEIHNESYFGQETFDLFNQLLDASGTLVRHHFERTLIRAAREHVERKP